MRKWWPLVAICLGTFMLLVDVTIVNVALPDMSRSLHASMASLQWIVDAYALTLAALLLTAGAAADLLGRRRVYLAGLAVFALASLMCALAADGGVLIAGRALQGTGGAVMFATTTALLTSVYEGRDRGIAFSVWGAVSSSAAAVGPTLGGVLTESWGWPSIFLVNLPVAVVTMVLARRVLPEFKATAGRRLDAVGALSFTVAAGATVAGLIESAHSGWGSPTVVTLLVVGAMALAVFVVTESTVAQPMLNLRLFRRPAFTALMLAAVLLQGAAFAHLGYTSMWLQTSLEMGPLAAGLVLTPLSLSALLVAAFAGRVLHGLPARIPVSAGLVLIGVGVLTETFIGPGSNWTVLLAGMVLSGIGAGVVTAPLVSAALSSVPPADAGTASGAVNTFRQLGQAIGVAVLGTVFVSEAAHTLAGKNVPGVPQETASALGGGQGRQIIESVAPARRAALTEALDAAFAHGLQQVFLIAGSAAVAVGVAAWFLMGRLGRDTHVPAQTAATAPPAPAGTRS
ncbi:MFS transporter [Streptomyces iconiensis]|uniref:MFS transporter n=2 Tax=Streptomyces iconiensis TaxID=1384038 RepID=A0ABT7A2S8_9ACTN|nr:MFS transporter [Streptomyces iconiensis]MDJ1135635.1 MFS transporter [Streptomyces iconiensis]